MPIKVTMASITVENYLKQLYLEQQESSADLVAMGKLANAMGVVPGTATSMVKALADSGLVSYEPRFGAKLTKGGEQLALHVLRRHRLVELFLVKVLGLDWSEVHEEAEELEHAISEKVLERIDKLLGHPSVDPHGDPIPSAKGKVSEERLVRLPEAGINEKVRIARIIDQDAKFLQFLNRAGLKPGVTVTINSRDEHADSISVKVEGKGALTLGMGAGMKILVEEV
jgi:DtxR family transcriptional regulator, Mn-dependent transcriptional regulator